MMGGVSFPVVFYDGETETSIGNVVVYPSTDFKSFQSVLSHKIGISPHQFTVYLAEDRKNNSNNNSAAAAAAVVKFYRRVPITAKANFSAISLETDCLFLVVLKRSRRDRDRDRRRNISNRDGSRGSHKWDPPANLTLLRRDNREISYGGYGIPEEVLAGLVTTTARAAGGYERERYLVNMGLNGLGLGSPDEKRTVINRNGYGCVVCEECLRAEEMGRDVGFHWCVYDAVTFGFRSPAGPIARPNKG